MIIGSAYTFLENIGSTNTYAAQLLKKQSVGEGTIFYTDFQSSGRGRKENRWESEPGKNLLFSTVLYPESIDPEDQFILSMFISLGVYDFISSQTGGCRIKWSNDIYAGDDKIAGILIEHSVEGNRIKNTLAGIGININQEKFPENIPNPTSLKLKTGKEYDLDSCLKQLANHLDKRYKQVLSGRGAEIKEEYVSLLYRLNEWYDFRTGKGLLHGRIVSVSDSGCLVIKDTNDMIFEFGFHEIEFIR